MPRALTNKQLAVLHALRERGEASAEQISEDLTGPHVDCPTCGGTGKGDEGYYHDRCGPCYGNGTRCIPRMDYPTAYQALQRLTKDGLATRRSKLDEWGDPIGGRIVYVATPVEPDPDDPLERAFAAPSAEVDR